MQDVKTGLDVRNPVLPSGAEQVLGLGGVGKQAQTQDGVALCGEMLAQPDHFLGRAGETVDEQAADPAAGKVERLATGKNRRKPKGSVRGHPITVRPRG